MKLRPLGSTPARLVLLEPFDDARGSFTRVWCRDAFRAAGIDLTPVQANVSRTVGRGTIRGMHVQVAPLPDAKLVRCTQGAIHDVIVDVRRACPTPREVVSVELGEGDSAMLYVPPGFAHGFQCLTEEATVEYLMGERFEPSLYRGFRYDDPAVAIDWPLPAQLVSERDLSWPALTASFSGAGER